MDMPYKDPQRKREWEWLHRPERLARRSELREIEALREEVQPATPGAQDGAAGFLWLPVVGGVVLASYNPKLAVGAGGLTLVAAAFYKKDWNWWIVGALIMAVGLLFQWNNSGRKKNNLRTVDKPKQIQLLGRAR
jgi:hypothetical protein